MSFAGVLVLLDDVAAWTRHDININTLYVNFNWTYVVLEELDLTFSSPISGKLGAPASQVQEKHQTLRIWKQGTQFQNNFLNARDPRAHK